MAGPCGWVSQWDADPQATPRLPVSFVAYALYANRASTAGSATTADLAANADRFGGQLPASYASASHTHDATHIASGNLSTDRYHAIDDLSAEGFLGNASGDLALNNGIVQTTLNADLLDGAHGASYAPASHIHDAGAITSGALAYDRFSAYGDLVSDSKIGAGSGMVAAGLHTHTGADIVDGSMGTIDLADGSVTSAKIADGAVANANLANSSVTPRRSAVRAPAQTMFYSTTVPRSPGAMLRDRRSSTPS